MLQKEHLRKHKIVPAGAFSDHADLYRSSASAYRFLRFVYQPGADAELMQARLHALGYLRKSEIDGDFGRITLGGLLAFQFENGLEVDGVCGPLTKAKLTL